MSPWTFEQWLQLIHELGGCLTLVAVVIIMEVFMHRKTNRMVAGLQAHIHRLTGGDTNEEG